MPCADRSATAACAVLLGLSLIPIALSGCGALISGQATAPPPTDDMAVLSSRSGCLACHALTPGQAGPNGLAPVGPSWPDIAQRYRAQSRSDSERSALVTRLTQAVREGTNPYASRWKGQISGLAMPPNAIAINEDDTRRLIEWILRLP